MLQRLSLHRRILLLATVVITVVSLFGLGMVIRERMLTSERDFADDARSIALAMLPMLENSLVVGDLATVQQTIDAIVKQDVVKRIALLDASGRQVVLEAVDATLADDHIRAPTWFRTLADANKFATDIRVAVGGVDYGTLRLEMSEYKLMDELWGSVLQFTAIGALCLAGIIALLSVALRQGLAPLGLLSRGARHIGAGELGERIPLVPVPEIADVARAFNNMADSIVQRNQELVHAKQAAEAGSRAKAAFLATMSHEIRTPMNGIMGLTDLMLTTPLSEEQQGYMNLVKASADTLLTILNDILDYSKIDAGKLTLESVPFTLAELVQQVTGLFASRSHDKRLELSAQIDPALPATLVGDPVRLRQVLTNLVGNALKFTEQGSVAMKVALVARNDDGCDVAFSVTDTGIGIPAEKLRLIFDPFSQADDTITRRYGGTGLGLAICRHLVELMGGKLSVDSVAGQGSSFRFTLHLGNHQAPTVAAPAASIARSGDDRNILVAEDAKANQILIVTLLKKYGYRVTLVENGADAIDACEREGFDLVLMDMQMPKLDGLAATTRIREMEARSGHRTPIVALTANAFEADRRRCLEAGMDDFIAKPFRVDELLAVLERHLA